MKAATRLQQPWTTVRSRQREEHHAGGTANLTARGTAADDVLIGNAGDDVLTSRRTTLDGGAGADCQPYSAAMRQITGLAGVANELTITDLDNANRNDGVNVLGNIETLPICQPQPDHHRR